MARWERAPARPRRTDAVPGTVGVGRVGGVPVRVHWSALVIVALTGWARVPSGGISSRSEDGSAGAALPSGGPSSPPVNA